MADLAIEQPAARKVPWHLWVVGVLSLLWNASGAYVIISAQSGAQMDMDANEVAYYAAQAPWFVLVTDVALIAAMLGALMLLLRNRWAVHFYALSIAAIVVTAAYDIAQGTALLLHDQGWLMQSCLTSGLAVAQLVYAVMVRKRGLLR
jgi:cell division protein FtsW (lipid II flippase)